MIRGYICMMQTGLCHLPHCVSGKTQATHALGRTSYLVYKTELALIR